MKTPQILTPLRTLGWPGALGLVALLAAAAVLLMAHGWDRDTQALQAQADAIRADLRARHVVAPSTANPPLNHADWLAQLPGAEQRQQRLADLLELAIRAGLASSQTEHRLSSAAGLEHLRVTMPVTGSYAQLRGFIEAALAHDAALSLDSLKLSRSTPQAAQLDAELIWSLHGRAAKEGS